MDDPAEHLERRLVRNQSSFRVPRYPSPELLEAEVHIAFTLWSGPVSADGESAACWVVVSDDRRPERAQQTITFGEHSGTYPGIRMVADVVAAIEAADGTAWVSVASKRVAVARALFDAGVPVTLGMRGLNRAEGLAASIAEESGRECSLMSVKAVISPDTSGDGTDSPLPPPSEADPRCRASVEPCWSPDVRVPAESTVLAGQVLFVATDGSADARGAAASSAVSMTGSVSVRASNLSFGAASVAEFDGLILAVDLIAEAGVRTAVVLCDSVDAVTLAQTIQTAGSAPESDFRGIGVEIAGRMWEALLALPCAIEFRKVAAHSGHPLNELADQAANLTRQASWYPHADIAAELRANLSGIRDAAAALGVDDIADWSPIRSEIAERGAGRRSYLAYSLAERLASVDPDPQPR